MNANLLRICQRPLDPWPKDDSSTSQPKSRFRLKWKAPEDSNTIMNNLLRMITNKKCLSLTKTMLRMTVSQLCKRNSPISTCR